MVQHSKVPTVQVENGGLYETCWISAASNVWNVVYSAQFSCDLGAVGAEGVPHSREAFIEIMLTAG